MDQLSTLLEAYHADPADRLFAAAVADCLEEAGMDREAELTRLHDLLRGTVWDEGPPAAEFARLCELLAEGVRPVTAARVNSVGMAFALLPPGEFVMGSPFGEPSRFADEGPEHVVRLTRGFYLGVHPVTQGQYLAAAGLAHGFFRAGGGSDNVADLDTSRHPVEMISHDAAVEFCAVLSALPAEAAAKRTYRLPTEAEWEYACRAGISRAGPYHWGKTINSRLANLRDGEFLADESRNPALERTAPVDAYPPNAFGLYDLHGNVSEWCADWFSPKYYEVSPPDDPAGPESGEHRVLRGGCWRDGLDFARAAFRYDRPPDQTRSDFGMRLVMVQG